MNEKEFIEKFVAKLDLHIELCAIATHKSLLYDLSIDDDGEIRKGVDPDSGEPVRGGGKGFEQDILIQDIPPFDGREVVPRVVAEVKFNSVTTHDVIVYSEKARRIRTVYPYLRYGLILGGFQRIPGRVLRLGRGFDFIFAISYPFVTQQVDATRMALSEEVQTSRDLARIAYGRQDITSFRRRVQYDTRNASAENE
jgi:hypothetical protein